MRIPSRRGQSRMLRRKQKEQYEEDTGWARQQTEKYQGKDGTDPQGDYDGSERERY